VPNIRGNHTKSSRTCGQFWFGAHRSGCGPQNEQLCPECSPVGGSTSNQTNEKAYSEKRKQKPTNTVFNEWKKKKMSILNIKYRYKKYLWCKFWNSSKFLHFTYILVQTLHIVGYQNVAPTWNTSVYMWSLFEFVRFTFWWNRYSRH